jgi:ubiquitin C-terminal hydrolase
MEQEEIFGDDKGLMGFSNLGNTCFMNSALQCLRYTIPLSAFFFDHNVTSENKLTNAYIKLCKKSWKFKGGAIAPREFKTALGLSNRRFMGYSQQDSQEMIIHLLDTIHESLNNQGSKNKKKRSIISDIFYGKFKQTVHCPNCKHDSITYQDFTDLEVPLITSKKSKYIELNDCFDNFTTEEELDDENMYRCEKCKKQVKAIKKMELDILPNYLIVTLKRFNRRHKLDNHVEFPLEGFEVLNKKYDLYATVNHYGGRHGGHYTASVKHPNGNWYKMNDSSCSKMSSKNVVNSSVYIAFFKVN